MTKELSNRQLAAVMFTDMVGYTALMQQDEQRARIDRDRHREVLERLIINNRGTIVQYFGDGTLCVFDSAIQAMKCALEIQTELQEAPPIPVRIGLHVGDIVYESGGVYGDAVNVASRIEAISVPGGVLFSNKVCDDIKNHPEFQFKSLGEFKFKNVKQAIEVFGLTNPKLKIPSAEDLKGKVPSAIKSVAVLPFANMSSDPENEYFSDGISEELINAFTKVEGLEVTARTSAFAFKGQSLDIREIGTQLGVDTILEGSVRKAGNRVRVTAQLINTADGYHLFSESYDRDLDDIFRVQDEIAQQITRKLTGKLSGLNGTGHLVKPRTRNIDAYNLYLKGIFYYNKWTPDGMKKAIEMFELALQMEPEFASACSWISSTYTLLGARGNILPEIAYPKAKEYALRAIELDEELYNSHLAIGLVKIFYEWDWEGAEKSILRAIQLNPGSGQVHNVYSTYLLSVGRVHKAIAQGEQAVRLDPLSMAFINQYAFTLHAGLKYDEALEQVEKLIEMDPNYRSAFEIKGWVLLSRGDYEKAIEVLKIYQQMTGSENKGLTGLAVAYIKAGRKQEAEECLRKMELRDREVESEVIDLELFVISAMMGYCDRAEVYLEKVVKSRSGGLFFMKANPVLKPIRENATFKETMKKYGLKGLL